jgi:hypothetical protein
MYFALVLRYRGDGVLKKSTRVVISFPCEDDLSPPWWRIIILDFLAVLASASSSSSSSSSSAGEGPFVGLADFAAVAIAVRLDLLVPVVAVGLFFRSRFRLPGKYGRSAVNPMGSSMP